MLKAVENRTFAKALETIRNERDLTQAEMSTAIKLSLRFYQSLESGEKEPSLATVQKALTGLGVTYYELFAMPEIPPRPNPQTMKLLIEASADEIPYYGLRAVIERYSKESPEVRAATLAVLYGDSSIAKPYSRRHGKTGSK